MNKFIATLMVGAALTLSACAGTDHNADYGYESQAPYADERTVGAEDRPAPQPERVFEQRQRK